MLTIGALLRCEGAQEAIDRIADPVTKNLVNMAFVHVVKSLLIEGRDAPRGDFDMNYFVTVLEPFFSEHDVLARTLAGEKVGAWFVDEGGKLDS